ncbi:MAG TPA: helix-turn-helix transcriptional regulator [Ktedonobacteraceae bacterium]|nr:helix-turn-helix transcriptional regulator [Ktedonobacteraceae bacterium]
MNNSAGKAKSSLQIERESRGWTRKYVANKIGVADYTIGQWERGEHRPYPGHIEKLCNLFDKNAEALGLAGKSFSIEIPVKSNDENSFEANEEQVHTTTSSPRDKHRQFLVPAIGIVLVLAITLSIFVYNGHPFSPIRIIPGGEWISPIGGTTIGDIIHFAAYAYPTHTGEPEIDHVNFTAFWQGVDPRVWIIACVARIPVRKDVFACTANLRLLKAQSGQIKISFDVYDRQGNVNFAPNGEHTVTYLPSSSK